MTSLDAFTYSKFASAAFPWSCRTLAEDAIKSLLPYVDFSYGKLSVREAVVLGERVQIPTRISFRGLTHGELQQWQQSSWPAALCLCTRSTDGYIRQVSLRRVLTTKESWGIPFVVLLAGEYVVEIAEDLVASLPAFDRDAYINFVRENRPMMRLLRSKATSYWDCYYRDDYPDRRTYPGLAFIDELDEWAK